MVNVSRVNKSVDLMHLHSPPAERVAVLERAGVHQTPILLQPLDDVFVCILKALRTERTKSQSAQRIKPDKV